MAITKKDISKFIPSRDIDDNVPQDEIQKEVLSGEISRDVRRLNAREIAKIALREKQANRIQAETGQRKYESAQIIKTADLSKPIIALPADQLSMAGTTKPEMLRLMHRLNINLNISLTKTDTYNLLAALLTCNEKQLEGLLANSKTPLAIKIIIKRLKDDYKTASTSTVEMVWDRLFGKSNMLMNLPSNMQGETGILPNQPVSREAYMIIRETLIGRGE